MKIKLYANTGIQIVDTKLSVPQSHESRPLNQEWNKWSIDTPWVQYKICQNRKIILAIDTSVDLGCKTECARGEETLPSGEEPLVILRISDLREVGLGSEKFEIYIHRELSGTGTPKNVAFVIDYGNSRTSALLVEDTSVNAQKLPAVPFELTPFYNNSIALDNNNYLDGEQVFTSRMGLINFNIPRVEYEQVEKIPAVFKTEEFDTGFFKGKKKREVEVRPAKEEITQVIGKTFTDISPVSLGSDTNNISSTAEFKTTNYNVQISSPKRYLWSKEKEDSFWYSFNPLTGTYKPADSSFFNYLEEIDSDISNEGIAPRYSKHTMMIPVIYELITNAYRKINSIEYREATAEAQRKRILKDIIITYPSAFTRNEIETYKKQILKAINVFCKTHNLSEERKPRLTMDLDEGTAGQLAYLYGELRSFSTAEEWMHVYGKTRNEKETVRIATIDIGGGTSDLSIAEYYDAMPGAATSLQCHLLRADGSNTAGDDLIEAICGYIVVPEICDKFKIENNDYDKLFRSVDNNEINFKRRHLISPLLKELGYKILEIESEIYQKGSAEINLAEILKKQKKSFREFCKIFNIEAIDEENTRQYNLVVHKKDLEECIHRVFINTLAFFADQIMRYDCDIVTLSGKPSGIQTVQDLIRGMLPLSHSRIIPMQGFKIGRWYPIQSTESGIIADPKSVVVVGAAINHLAKYSAVLSNIRIDSSVNVNANRFHYWAQITAATERRTFSNDEAFFTPNSLNGEVHRTIMAGRSIFIGRRSDQKEVAPAIPTYELVTVNCRPSRDLSIMLTLHKNNDDGDYITISDVQGKVVLLESDEEIEANLEEHFSLKARSMLENEHFVDSGYLRDFNING